MKTTIQKSAVLLFIFIQVMANSQSNPLPVPANELLTAGNGFSNANTASVLSKTGFAAYTGGQFKKSAPTVAPLNVPTDGNALQVGGGYFIGYSGFLTRDKDNASGIVTRHTFNGFNTGFEGDVRYQLCDHGAIDGDFRFLDYDEGFYDENDGAYTYDVGYRQFQLGIDFMAEWNPCHDTWLYGGPSLNFNAKMEYGDGNSRSDIDWKTFSQLSYPLQSQYMPNAVNVGFNLGIKYQFKLGQHIFIDPFIQSRIPFSRNVNYDGPGGPSDYQNFKFNLDFGARVLVGVK